MRAVQIRTFGEPRIVLELADFPEPPAQAAGEVLIGVSFLRRTLSPRLSLAGRDPIHSSVTDRHFIHEAPTEQLVEKKDNAGDPRQDLKSWCRRFNPVPAHQFKILFLAYLASLSKCSVTPRPSQLVRYSY